MKAYVCWKGRNGDAGREEHTHVYPEHRWDSPSSFLSFAVSGLCCTFSLFIELLVHIT